jgi:hypothetical protein
MKAATSDGAAFLFARTSIMAFIIRDLSVLAYANGFTLWHYRTVADSPAHVARADYFSDASDMMAAGDMILVSGAKACRMLCISLADAGNVRSAPVG